MNGRPSAINGKERARGSSPLKKVTGGSNTVVNDPGELSPPPEIISRPARPSSSASMRIDTDVEDSQDVDMEGSPPIKVSLTAALGF